MVLFCILAVVALIAVGIASGVALIESERDEQQRREEFWDRIELMSAGLDDDEDEICDGTGACGLCDFCEVLN